MKAGDTVVCVEGTDLPQRLYAGRLYTIESVGSLAVKLKGLETLWNKKRFKIALSTINRPVGGI